MDWIGLDRMVKASAECLSMKCKAEKVGEQKAYGAFKFYCLRFDSGR